MTRIFFAWIIILSSLVFVTKSEQYKDYCDDGGTLRPNLSVWRRNACTKCKCQGGVIECIVEQCEDPGCDTNKGEALFIPPNGCCPRCTGVKKATCQHNGKTIAHNTEWKDNCLQCLCNDGDIECSEVVCPSLLCGYGESAWKSPGECCTKCARVNDPCIYNNVTYRDGEAWSPSKCLRAKCNKGDVELQVPQCKSIACPPSQVLSVKEDHCCPSCFGMTCIHGGRTYESGSQFEIDACTHCVCMDGDVSCHATTCNADPIDGLHCPAGYDAIVKPDKCCPECVSTNPSCQYEGSTHFDEEIWNAEMCKVCSCKAGIVRCFDLQCTKVSCYKNETLVHRPDQCCPECAPVTSYCSYNDLTYRHGDEWQASSCERCMCVSGTTQCFKTQCTQCPSHTVAVTIQDECCPICEPITCHSDCATCSEAGYGNCLTCKNPRNIIQNGKCLRRCLSGFYRTEQNACEPCDETCKTCDKGKSKGSCTSCHPPMLLQNNVCVDDCTNGFFEENQNCRRCHETCEKCFSTSLCVSCINRTQLIQDNQCVDVCHKGYFQNNSRCLPCRGSCATCTSTKQCETCPRGKLFEERFCVSTCSQHYYQDTTDTCRKCDDSCDTCTGSLFSNCTSCSIGLVLHAGKCLTFCPPGTFNNNGQCNVCHDTCRFCVGSLHTECTYCSSAFHVVSPQSNQHTYGECLSNCRERQHLSGKICKDCHESCSTCSGSQAQDCTSCKGNSVILKSSPMSNECVTAQQCTEFEYQVYGNYCLPTDGLFACKRLRKALLWDNLLPFTPSQHCVENCPSGNYAKMTDQGNLCVSCGSNCNACQSASRCIECGDGFSFSLLSKSCVAICEEGFYQELPGICRSCPAHCSSCKKSFAFGQPRCTSCREHSAVLQFGECIQQCPNQFYAGLTSEKLGTSMCRQCPWSDLQCYSPNHSIQCMSDFYLKDSKCVTDCGSGHFTSNNICISCSDSNCANCTILGCTGCKSGYLLHNGKCLTSCPLGTVESKSNDCQTCPLHCLSCPNDLCNQCDGQTFMMSENEDLLTEGHRRDSRRTCVKECPRGSFRNTLTRVCEVDIQAPLLNVYKPIVVSVGGRFLITEEIVSVIDDDSDERHLSLLVAMSPANGWLEMDGNKLQTGSQISYDDLLNEKLWFVHDTLSNHRSGVLSFTAFDRYLKSQPKALDIIVVSNKKPVLVKNDVMTVRVDKSASVGEFLQITDEDNEDDVSITVISDTRKGMFCKKASRKQIDKFSLRDVIQQQVEYTPSRRLRSIKTVENDQLLLQVNDGFHILNVVFQINIIPRVRSHKPVLQTTMGHVRAGGVLHLTANHLQILAPDVKDKTKLVYSLTPVNYTSGEVVMILPMSSDAPAEIDSWSEMERDLYRSPPRLRFNQKEVDEGKIWYRDLGGHGDIEAFEFQVLDESEYPPVQLAKDVFHVTVVEENSEAPRVARGVKFPLEMSAEEDTITVIHNGYIRFTDDDTPDRDLIYNITRSLPSNFGSVEHADNPYVPITVFTQSDVDSNKIIYRPAIASLDEIEDIITDEIYFDAYEDADDSVENSYDMDTEDYERFDDESRYDLGKLQEFKMELREAPRDGISFEFTVSDGQHTLPANNFTIKLITGTSAAPVFRNFNPSLDVTQGGTVPIGEQQLAVDDPDTLQYDLSFTLVKSPRHGSIVRNDQGTRVIMSEGEAFLYNMIQRNALQYVHDGSDQSENDQLQVSVTDITHTTTKMIQIRILATNGVGPTPDPSTELSLVTLESTTVALTRENLAYIDMDSDDEQIEYHVEEGPRYGELDSDEIESVDSFTQQDINDGLVLYRSEGHVGSHPRTDILQFSVSDAHGNKLPNQILTITVTPGINQPPIVSVGEGLVVEEGGRILVTPSNVIVSDADTLASEIVITITTNPKFGYFLNNIRPDAFNPEESTWFTMQDILDGGIYYIQSLHHKMEPDHDYFHFRVSDGHTKTSHYRINVTIMPKNDEEPEMEIHTLICKSGQATMILNGSLNVHDPDTENSNLEFVVTSLPENGALVKFSEKMPINMINEWQRSRNGEAEMDMRESKKISRLRIGSRFTYQDILDGLVWFQSEGFGTSTPITSKSRRRRDALGFVLSDGRFEKQGSIQINVDNDRDDFDNFDELDNEEDGQDQPEVFNIITSIVPVIEINTGIEAERGSITSITNQNLQSTADGRFATYIVTKHPEAGALQLSKGQFKLNLTSSGEREFTQQDIDEGLIRYVHNSNEPGGHFYFRFNVMGDSGNSLTGQTFDIIVAQDTLPPTILVNTGIVVKEGSSAKINSQKLSATDDKSDRLVYTILDEPKLGRVEYVRQPGRSLSSFTQSDVISGLVRYVHTSTSQSTDDSFKFSLSDGTNSVAQTFIISVTPVDNSIPLLKNSGIRVQEGVRKTITEFELKATDQDTANDRVVFTISQSPVHGTVERTTNNGRRYIPVTSFSMEDIYQSRISYSHDGSNFADDMFTFVVSDGTNPEFTIIEEGESVTTSSPQTFNIEVLPVDDGTPRLVTNLGLNHLEFMDNKALGMIKNKHLLTEDPDTNAQKIIYMITSAPRHGYLENTVYEGDHITSFTQADVNDNVIRYVLNEESVYEAMDSFMFNVRDSLPNVVTGNLFHIRWSVISFEEPSYTVKEGIGKIHVPVRRHGNLNEYVIVLCQTESGTALSTGSMPDFENHATQVQFEEHEDEKTCEIQINDDQIFEGSESFYVELTMPHYALLGDTRKTQIIIDDSADMPSMSFVESKFVIDEQERSAFVPVKRTGDVTKPVTVVCFTEQGTATESGELIESGADFKIRRRESTQSIVSFSAGATTATCDIQLIDDSMYEEDEFFTIKLVDPSTGSKIGEIDQATVTISGPNDAAAVFFSGHKYEFTENSGTVDIKVSRTGSDLSQTTDVWCATRSSNPQSAVPGEDFVQTSNKVTFRNGETTKLCSLTILDDSQSPSVEGNETFEVYLTSVLRAQLVEPMQATIIINDTLDDVPTMEFIGAAAEVKESDKTVSLAIKREGDVASESSVICYTRSITANADDDFAERSQTETSRIVFKPEQKVAFCNITIIDDSSYESIETFSVHLVNANSNKWYGAKIGESDSVIVTITNTEDAPTIQFERAEYSIREPDSGDDAKQLVVYVVRAGDTSEVSKVRCSTRDGSATSGSDYEPKSRMIRFAPGDTRANFRVNILPTDDTEWHETFLIVLGPDEPVNAVLGKISTVTVTVLDRDAAGSLVLPTTPVVVSLLNYDNVEAGLEANPSPGYPLICVTPCDPHYPDYIDTRNLCEQAGINASAIKFSWEVATPTHVDGGSPPFERVKDSTPFTSVDKMVLDSIYFSRRFHVRCVAQAVDSITKVAGIPLRSNVATIGTSSGLCHNPIVAGSERGFQAQSFIAKLSYIPPAEDNHPNSLKISVEIPHQDGRLPLISTMPLNNIKLLSRSIDRQQHLCSNLMYSSNPTVVPPTDGTEVAIKSDAIGSFLGFIEPTDYSLLSLSQGFDKPYQLDPKVREAKTIDLYKYLNLKSCSWKFEAYYKMNELIDFCNGKLTTDYQLRDEAKSRVTVSVPLYVSYVYVTAPTGWGSLEHSTDMEFSFDYSNVLVREGVQTDSELKGELIVDKLTMRDDGRLVIEFRTRINFRGLFVLNHRTSPERESRVLAPTEFGITFDLELSSTQNTFDSPTQKWRATSSYSLKDYSGEYKVVLIPCTVGSKQKWSETLPNKEVACTASSPIEFTFPMTFQQTNRPVPVIYSLHTQFHLSNNDKFFSMDPTKFTDTSITELDYKGSFSKGQTIYGRVLWNPQQDLNSAYRLRLEKVYLCTGKDAYIPYFDPTGEIYHEGPQYGCIQPGKNLQHRFLLLDRENPQSQNLYFHDVPFDAHFASDHPDFAAGMSDLPGVDGFLMKVDALYTVQAGHQWFLQVLYEIGPDELLRSGRAKRAAAMIAMPTRRKRRSAEDVLPSASSNNKNGTNMRSLTLDKSQLDSPLPLTTILLIVGVAVVFVAFVIFICCCCVLGRRKKRSKKEPTKMVDEEEMEELFKPKLPATVNVKVVSLPKKENDDNKLEKNYMRSRQRRADVNYVVPPKTDGRRNNENSLRPLLGSQTRRKNIPIVNNLKNNRDETEEDGTEV